MKQLIFLCMFLVVSVMLMANSPFPQGFENITEPKGEYFHNNPNFAPVTIKVNPLKAGINTSDKVAAVRLSPTSSGIIRINFEAPEPFFEYPKHPDGFDEFYYDVLRFKYYSDGKQNKYVELEPNGVAASPKILVQPDANYHQEWAYVSIPLYNKMYANFQIRINRNAAGNGAATGTEIDDVVYVDDFEIFNSIVGPTSVRKLEVNSLFTYKQISDGQFSIDAFLNNISEVRVDLISLDGRVNTIYNQVVGGALQIPFTLPSKGIYAVRMIVNNQQSFAEKIISQ